MGACSSCCSSGRDVVLNGRRLKERQLLGEGGFGFVYMVEDVQTTRKYALKRMLCQEQEQVDGSLHEADLYRQFDHANLMKIIDIGVVNSHAAPGAKEVLLLFPCYRNGSLQDMINNMAQQEIEFTETEAVALFISICQGVKELHQHDPPFAHRDMKPGNVMLTDNNAPVVTDFGSLQLARVRVESRAQALEIQDRAAEQSTAPYRAPELFDVPSEGMIDERTDIWSLGCLLYAMAFKVSPFESAVGEIGGSIALAAMNGRVNFPRPCSFSKAFCDLIMFMLNTDRSARPFIDDVIERSRALLRQQLNPI